MVNRDMNVRSAMDVKKISIEIQILRMFKSHQSQKLCDDVCLKSDQLNHPRRSTST